MPKENGIGTSAATAIKHRQTEGLLKMHMAIVHRITQRHSWVEPPYHYFDLTAGRGEHDGNPTAPGQCGAVAAELGLPCVGRLYEVNEEHAIELRGNVAPFKKFSVCGRDFMDHLEYDLRKTVCSRKQRMGLIYYDPTAYKTFPNHIRVISRALEHKRTRCLDLLMHINAASIKKMAGCGLATCLRDYLRTIPKKHWIVRSPETAWQFSLILGTNWLEFPAWEKEGFHGLDSTEGMKIWNQLCLTASQLKHGESIQPIGSI